MTEDEKLWARKTAIQTAERLSPSKLAQNNQLGTGLSTQPTVEQVLETAEKIYNWLIKTV